VSKNPLKIWLKKLWFYWSFSVLIMGVQNLVFGHLQDSQSTRGVKVGEKAIIWVRGDSLAVPLLCEAIS